MGFLGKVNCFYLMTNSYIAKATEMDKIGYSEE